MNQAVKVRIGGLEFVSTGEGYEVELCGEKKFLHGGTEQIVKAMEVWAVEVLGRVSWRDGSEILFPAPGYVTVRVPGQEAMVDWYALTILHRNARGCPEAYRNGDHYFRFLRGAWEELPVKKYRVMHKYFCCVRPVLRGLGFIEEDGAWYIPDTWVPYPNLIIEPVE